MPFQFLAEDVGFDTNPSKVESSEKICIDGFYFPKNLPKPVLKKDTDLYYTSDQAKDSELIHSLLPSYHTQSHCVIVPKSQVPPPLSFRSVDTSDVQTLEVNLETARKQLQNLLKAKKAAEMNEDQTRVSELVEEINNCYDTIIQIHLAIFSDNDRRTHPKDVETTYVKEVYQYIQYLKGQLAQTESNRNIQLTNDIEELTQGLDDYVTNVCHETELRLKKTYHLALSKYSY